MHELKKFAALRPFMWQFRPLGVVTERAGDHDVLWPIRPATRKWLDVINMKCATYLLRAVIAFAVLGLVLALYIGVSVIAASGVLQRPAAIRLDATKSPEVLFVGSVQFAPVLFQLFSVGNAELPLLLTFALLVGCVIFVVVFSYSFAIDGAVSAQRLTDLILVFGSVIARAIYSSLFVSRVIRFHAGKFPLAIGSVVLASVFGFSLLVIGAIAAIALFTLAIESVFFFFVARKVFSGCRLEIAAPATALRRRVFGNGIIDHVASLLLRLSAKPGTFAASPGAFVCASQGLL